VRDVTIGGFAVADDEAAARDIAASAGDAVADGALDDAVSSDVPAS
jgi:hypothetical protein